MEYIRIIATNILLIFLTSKGIFASHTLREMLNERRGDTTSNRIDGNPEKSRDLHVHMTHHQNGCCALTWTKTIAGFDMDDKPVFVKRGKCENVCFQATEKSKVANRRRRHHHHHKRIIGCGTDSECRAGHVRIEQFHLKGGTTSLEITESCQCSPRPHFCTRRSQWMTYFPDSPFQVDVDVGACAGPCSQGTSCKPSKNKTVAISGPNGHITIPTIVACGCHGDCYRMSHKQVYTTTVINSTTGRSEEMVREIDIGKCLGECYGEPGYKCVMRSKDNVCLMSLKKRSKSCRPSSYTPYNIRTASMQKRPILAIKHCGCQ